jgi:hypothetical protein
MIIVALMTVVIGAFFLLETKGRHVAVIRKGVAPLAAPHGVDLIRWRSRED